MSPLFLVNTHREAERNYIYIHIYIEREFLGFLMRVLCCNLPGMLVRLQSTLNFPCCQSDVKFQLGAMKVESNENKLTAVSQQAKTREMKIHYHENVLENASQINYWA